MKNFYAVVQKFGDGVVTLWVMRGTEDYPPEGSTVEIRLVEFPDNNKFSENLGMTEGLLKHIQGLPGYAHREPPTTQELKAKIETLIELLGKVEKEQPKKSPPEPQPEKLVCVRCGR